MSYCTNHSSNSLYPCFSPAAFEAWTCTWQLSNCQGMQDASKPDPGIRQHILYRAE